MFPPSITTSAAILNSMPQIQKTVYFVRHGETFADIVARADTALNDLLARHETNIVAVSHGHFLRTIVARILLGEALTPQLLRRFHSLAGMENTAITVVQYGAAHQEPPTWRLWTYNDHAHFAD